MKVCALISGNRWKFVCGSGAALTSHIYSVIFNRLNFPRVMLFLFSQVEETAREREERLKGWSTFLDAGEQTQQNNSATKPAETGAAAEPTEASNAAEAEQKQATEPQSSEQQEQDVDSTDSSLAGSDDEQEVA